MGLKMVKCEKCGAYIFEDSECPYCKEAENEAPFNSAAYSGFAGASPAVKVKEGIPLPIAIIGSVICVFALMLYILNLYRYRTWIVSDSRFLYEQSIFWLSIITGIPMCIVAIKKLVLAVIPEGLAALYLLVVACAGSSIVSLIEMLTLTAAAVLFILASVKNNKSGIIFAVISMVLLFLLSTRQQIYLLSFFTNYPDRFFYFGVSVSYSFARYGLYTAFGLISLGVLIRNVKSAKA